MIERKHLSAYVMTPTPVEQRCTTAPTPRALSQVLLAAAIGLFSWAASNVHVLRAHIQPPAGTQPLWTPREIDIALHLTWVNGMRNALLIPNYHLPAVTSPGLFCPLMALLGQFTKLGIDASAAYAIAELLLGIIGAYVILLCLRLFLTSRWQYVAAVVLVLAATPLLSSLTVWHALRGADDGRPIFFMGDGLFIPEPVTIALGTVSVYASLFLVTQYVLLGQRRYLYVAGLVAAISGLCHPFEVFTILGATTLTFVVLGWPRLRSALGDALIVIGICLPA